MKMKEVCQLYYSIILYKNNGYDCFKYKFKLPSSYNKSLERFYEKNKMELQNLVAYDKAGLVLRVLLNVFIKNYNINVMHVSEKDYNSFKDSLFEYKNEISKFLNLYKVQTAKEVYLLYIKKKIPFYIFYYVLLYTKFEDKIQTQELIKNKFIEVHYLMKFFKHFDEDYIKKELVELQKEIELQRS